MLYPTVYLKIPTNSGKNNTHGMLLKVYATDKVSVITLEFEIIESTLYKIDWCVIKLFSEIGLQDPEFAYGARIAWGRNMNTEGHWNEVSIWGVENFGLPGDRYITDININDMTWWFKYNHDRLLFILRNGQAQSVQHKNNL